MFRVNVTDPQTGGLLRAFTTHSSDQAKRYVNFLLRQAYLEDNMTAYEQIDEGSFKFPPLRELAEVAYSNGQEVTITGMALMDMAYPEGQWEAEQLIVLYDDLGFEPQVVRTVGVVMPGENPVLKMSAARKAVAQAWGMDDPDSYGWEESFDKALLENRGAYIALEPNERR